MPAMTRGLASKRALGAGAGPGVGSAIAARLAAEGAGVVCFDRSGAEAEVASEIGASAVAVGGDVTRAADLERAVATASDRFGGLEILVNNAGTSGRAMPLTEASEEL